MELSSEIVSGKELEKANRERKRDYIFENIVEEARDRYIEEGWEVDRELANRKVKMKKLKPADEIFENRVWTMLYKLGFTHMNRDNKFKIEYKQNGKQSSKQIDVLAADSEIVLLIECKCANKPRTRQNFKTDIEAISGYRKAVFNELNEIFPNHKKVCVFATNNYEITETNKDLLENQNIRYFNESTVEYYESLGKALGRTARYQLLGNLFAGQKISEMATKVAAIKGKMGGRTYYSFSVEPSKLLKMSYILHRNSAQPEEVLPTYQRLIKKSRLKDIQKFINNGGFFPNSIIVNINSESASFKPAPMKNQPEDSDSRIGILELPQKYRSVYVIDGQHRLYGYADSDYEGKDTIPVVAFYDLDNKDQIKMFMDINEKQKAVPQTLRTTLNADLLWDAPDMGDRQKALRSRIAQELGELKKSPLYNRVIVGENAKGPKRTITLPFIDKAIDKAGYLGKYKDNAMIENGLFEYGDIDTSYKRIIDYLVQSFSYIEEIAPEEWDKEAKQGAIFTVNVGVYALICVCADILRHLQDTQDVDVRNAEMEELVETTEFFLLPLVDCIKELDQEGRNAFTKKYGGNATKECWFKFRQIIHDAHSDFDPEGLSDWVRDNSMQYNDEFRNKLYAIENRIADQISNTLEKEYGEDWMRLGVERNVFTTLNNRATDRQYNTGGELDPWREVTLEECRKIVTWSRNWRNLFKPFFESLVGDGKSHNKKDLTEWMTELNRVQKQLKTIKDYSVSYDDYILVCDYYDKLDL